jgi:L-lactate dehydrogenase
MPIGSYQPKHGVTLSLPSVLGRQGVTRVLEPEMSDEEGKALERSADTLRTALARIRN